MTTLAVPRSLRTSATSICHALVDAKMDHRATSLKIQGYLNLATVYRIHSMHRGETEQRAMMSDPFSMALNGLSSVCMLASKD
jgi:hypothetical protein